jgi:hypothetical protein
MTSRHDPARTELSEPTRILESDAPETAHLREALRTLGPTRVDDVAKARVRRSLTREERPKKASSTWLVPVLAVGLLLATAVAGASMPSVRKHLPFVESGVDTNLSHPEKSPTKPAGAIPMEAPSGSAPEPTVASLAASVSPVTPAPTESPDVTPAVAQATPVVHPRTSPPGVVTPPAAPSSTARGEKTEAERPEPSQGGDLVVGAMRALRRENDATKAARLLGDYRRAYPLGPLDEEALALAIEAGLRLKDGSAPTHARTYLDRYPRGRFAHTAESALVP